MAEMASKYRIFSMAEMASKYRITYNNTIEDALIVHVNNKKIRFKKAPSGLHVLKMDNNRCAGVAIAPQMAMVTTIEENKTFYTESQLK